MNNKNVLNIALTAFLALALIAIGVYAYRGRLAHKGGEPAENQPAESEQLIGGQTDDHGCLIAAGYSWCEAKQKCLRTWEEACDEDSDTNEEELGDADLSAIKQAFMDKNAKSADEGQVTVEKAVAGHARGSVKFARPGEPGEGGIFLAYKEEGVWKLAFDGNGGISCALTDEYGFPADMIPDCADENTGAGTPEGAQLPNPASVYCEEQGGMSEIVTALDGSQSGICVFADGSECDEWEFFRGECQTE